MCNWKTQYMGLVEYICNLLWAHLYHEIHWNTTQELIKTVYTYRYHGTQPTAVSWSFLTNHLVVKNQSYCLFRSHRVNGKCSNKWYFKVAGTFLGLNLWHDHMHRKLVCLYIALQWQLKDIAEHVYKAVSVILFDSLSGTLLIGCYIWV